jgi:hypothetical protein
VREKPTCNSILNTRFGPKGLIDHFGPPDKVYVIALNRHGKVRSLHQSVEKTDSREAAYVVQAAEDLSST